MYVCAHTHIHCYITGLFGRRILFGSLLQFTPGVQEEEEEQLPQPGGGEGNAVGVGQAEPLPQPGEGDADADSYWNRSRIQSAKAVPIRVVRRHPTHYDSQVRGMCVCKCVCSILWLSNAIYVIQGAAAAESRGRCRGSAASRANRLYSHSLLHATVQFTVSLLEHAASYA